MLPLLLLPLFISFASSACMSKVEFRANMMVLGKNVQNCSENCSSVHITDGACKCLNLNESGVNCTTPGYAIYAIKALASLQPKQEAARHLNRALTGTMKRCPKMLDFCSLPVNLSPKTFYKVLEDLAQKHNSGR